MLADGLRYSEACPGVCITWWEADLTGGATPAGCWGDWSGSCRVHSKAGDPMDIDQTTEQPGVPFDIKERRSPAVIPALAKLDLSETVQESIYTEVHICSHPHAHLLHWNNILLNAITHMCRAHLCCSTQKRWQRDFCLNHSLTGSTGIRVVLMPLHRGCFCLDSVPSADLSRAVAGQSWNQIFDHTNQKCYNCHSIEAPSVIFHQGYLGNLLQELVTLPEQVTFADHCKPCISKALPQTFAAPYSSHHSDCAKLWRLNRRAGGHSSHSRPHVSLA